MDRRARWESLLALVVFLAAFSYLATGLTARECEVMESQDLGLARNLFVGGHYNLPGDQSPLNYFLLNACNRLSDTSVFIWRLPAAIFVALAVLLLYLTMRREIGRTGGLLAAFFLTISPLAVIHGRSARMYGLVILAAAWSLYQAYLYLAVQPKPRYLAGLVVGLVVGVYSHLFFLLFAAGLGLMLLVHQVAHRRERGGWLRLAIAGAAGILAISPQLWRVVSVMKYTGKRHANFQGLPHRIDLFLDVLGRELLLGGQRLPVWWLAALAVAPLLGLAVWKKRGWLLGLCLVAPSLGMMWALSFTHPVEARYLVFLLPVLAAAVAVLAMKLRAVWLWAPLALLLAAPSIAATQKHFQPRTDWARAGEFVQSRRTAAEPLAAFPHFFKWTFAGYGGESRAVSVNSPDILDRILARGERVFLVAGPGRYFGAIDAYLKHRAVIKETFSTAVRQPLKVFVVRGEQPAAFSWPPTDDPTVILTGVIGSGGYQWQNDPAGPDPFARVAPLLRQADLTLTILESHGPEKDSWARRLLGHDRLPAREPNAAVLARLKNAGVDGVALLPAHRGDDDSSLFAAAGLWALPAANRLTAAKPGLVPLRDRRLAVLNLGQVVSLEKPRHRRKTETGLKEWDQAVVQARNAIGPNARLIVIMSQPLDYDRLLSREAQLLARRAIDLGADVVIGAGGRAAREIETYRRGLIAYSLGSFLLPTFQSGWAGGSGFALRLRFPDGEPPRFDTAPLTFDDLGRPAHGKPTDTANLEYRPPTIAEENLTERLMEAKVTFRRKGKKDGVASNYVAAIRPGRSIHEGYRSSQEAFVGVGGVRSLGEYRRALVFDPGKVTSLAADFADITLGESMRVSFAIGDTDLYDGRHPKMPPVLEVWAGKEKLLSAPVHFKPGWRTSLIETGTLAGERRVVSIRVGAFDKKKFPVAVEAVILREPKTLQTMQTAPVAFREHLGEARVEVETADGKRTECTGPDEAFRWLRNEEKGAYGEGVLYRRWVCGVDLWDAAALTYQKSGGELRPAIWLHPLTDARRVLTFGPLPLRAKLHGYFGITDRAVKMKTGSVVFSIRLGDEEIHRVIADNRAGWRNFEVTIPAHWRGRMAEISFLAEAPDQSWRHFCFNAWMD